MAQWLETLGLKPASGSNGSNGSLLDTAEIVDERSLDDHRGGGGRRMMMATENPGAPSVEKRFDSLKSDVGALFNPHKYGRTSLHGIATNSICLVDDPNDEGRVDEARLGAAGGADSAAACTSEAAHARKPAVAPATPPADVNLLSFDEVPAAATSAPPPPSSAWQQQQQQVLVTQQQQQQQQQALMLQYQQMQWQQHVYLQHQYQYQQRAMMPASCPAPAAAPPGVALSNPLGPA